MLISQLEFVAIFMKVMEIPEFFSEHGNFSLDIFIDLDDNI